MGEKKTVGKAEFEKMSKAEKLAVAKCEKNRDVMSETRAMCDPHGRLSEYADEQWVQLASAFFVMSERGHLSST